MPDDSSQPKRVLDPVDRIIEAVFGIVMVLTFTCTVSTVESTRADVRSMLQAAVGCNVAWGIVDGIMYLVARITQRLKARQLLESVRTSAPRDGALVLSAALPPVVREALGDSGIETLRSGLKELSLPTERSVVTGDDILGAIAIFLIAVTFAAPVILPFVVMDQIHPAMRVSNAIALVMLFLLGVEWANLVGLPRWRVGIAMALGGAILVGTTIALGG